MIKIAFIINYFAKHKMFNKINKKLNKNTK